MEIKNFDKEFVERTKTIIQSQCNDSFIYDVTLLLNCLTGLVSLPTEKTRYKDISFKTICVNKLKCMGVIIISTDDDKTFRTIKNAISHMNIVPKNQNGLIDSIVFCDRKTPSDSIHTQLQFSVAQLKEFALFVADKHFERFEK